MYMPVAHAGVNSEAPERGILPEQWVLLGLLQCNERK